MATPTLEQAIADARQCVAEAKHLRDDRLARTLSDRVRRSELIMPASRVEVALRRYRVRGAARINSVAP
jgi:hypothetical protein